MFKPISVVPRDHVTIIDLFSRGESNALLGKTLHFTHFTPFFRHVYISIFIYLFLGIGVFRILLLCVFCYFQPFLMFGISLP